MIVLGTLNTLTILRETSVGLFLGDEEGTDILLPNKYVPLHYDLGDQLSVFCYLDHEERPVATTLTPFVMRNQFQLLRAVEVNQIGAFMDWGLEKHLFVPFKEQRQKMTAGQSYVVFCYLDEKSFRLVGSNKIDKFLSNEGVSYEVCTPVSVLISRKSDLGWDAIIEHKHKGLLYENEVFSPLHVGQITTAYIKHLRPDGKIDLQLKPLGVEALAPAAEIILQFLADNGGSMPYGDFSTPQELQEVFQMSKKTFKKALGTLYKEQKVTLSPDGTQLV